MRNRDSLPPGRYRARVKRRQSISDGGQPSVLLTFVVNTKRFQGRRVTGRFWSYVLVERAKTLNEGELVDIDVVGHSSARRRQSTVVKDFRPAGKPTVVTFVSGVVPPDPSSSCGVHHEFGPAAVVTERELDEVEAERVINQQEGFAPPPLPLMASHTLAMLNAQIAHGTPSDHGEQETVEYRHHAHRVSAKHRWTVSMLGGKSARRVLVPADQEFSRLARLGFEARPDSPAYLSAYEYSDDLRLYQQAHSGSVSGYCGITWARRCALNFEGQAGLQDVLQPARSSFTALERLGVARKQILIFFSGQRGIHLMFPSGCVGSVPQTNFEFAVGQLCQVIADQATLMLTPPKAMKTDREAPDEERRGAGDPGNDATWHEAIDWNVYKPNAMLLAPNTRHEETGLYKVRLTPEELETLEPEEIEKLAVAPRLFEPPAWESEPLEVLCELWRYAVAVANSRTFATTSSVDGECWVYADTFDFMHNGAPELTRVKRLFRAAVNLLQVGCSRTVVYQLLSPAALMSGLSSTTTRRQIEDAIAYLRRPRQVVLNAGFLPPIASNHLNGGE